MSNLLETICSVIRSCGAIYATADDTAIRTTIKSGEKDLVTQYDVKTQEFAVQALSNIYPTAKFYGEENERNTADLDAALTFVIDPIDGTANFASDYRHSCTSIAALSYGKPIAGAVYNPYSKELFYAEKGKGAYCNGRPIHVTNKDLKHSFVLFGTSPYDPELASMTFRVVSSIFGNCLDVRRSGSAALDLCYAACGRVGLFFEGALSIWDYAAGALLVEEAGGCCMGFDGKPLSFSAKRQSMLSGSPSVIQEAQPYLQSACNTEV